MVSWGKTLKNRIKYNMEDNIGNINNVNTKRCGAGTSSLMIAIFSVIFSFSSLGKKFWGKYITCRWNKISGHDYFNSFIHYCNFYRP